MPRVFCGERLRMFTGSTWTPPAYHGRDTRERWLPALGEFLMPWRLMDDMVWVRTHDGRSGVGQVLYTYDVWGHVPLPMGEMEVMDTACIATANDMLPRLYWVPSRTHFTVFEPYSVWVVRWLSSM